MKKVLVFLELICIVNFVTAQQSNQIDSLRQALISSKDDTNSFKILNRLVAEYLWSGPDTSLLYAQQQLLLAKKTNSVKWEARALGNYGGSLDVLGNYPQALDYSLQAFRLAEKQHDTAIFIDVCFGLSSIYSDIGDNNHALYYSLIGVRISEKFNKGSRFPEALIIAGAIFEQSNQLDSALIYTQKGYELDSIYNAKHVLGYAPYIFGNIHYKTSKYLLALEYYRSAVTISREQNIQKDLMDIYNGMSKTFIKTRQFDSAIFYSKLILFTGRSTAYPLGMLNAYTTLSGIYKSLNNMDSTQKYNELTASIRDSIFNKERVTQFQNLSFSEQLRKQDIETAQLQYQGKVKLYASLGGLAVLLILAGILWRNNRSKQRSNTLLQSQKEEIAVQKLKAEQSLHQLKSTQAQLIQSEKMASLGELTAGIAHEIQNPLNFVNNFSEVNNELIDELKNELQSGKNEQALAIADDIKDNQQKINHHGKRADAIVKGMLQHSQAGKGQKQPTDINALCDEYLRLSYHGFRAKDNSFNSIMKTDFDESIRQINIIPQDIGRVLLNLYNNAFYAVNEKMKTISQAYNPTITVTTKNLNDKIEISVSDNGNGIPQNIIDKIFQPFFTTKPTGQGTGLGLSLSYDIIKAHSGEFKVETKEGEGAEFTIQVSF